MKSLNKKVNADYVMSQRLNLLKILSILSVIYIHSQSLIINNSDSFILERLNNLVSNGLARSAVPIFFILSGYFLFCDGSGLIRIKYKLKKRLRTVLVPFLVWNILFYLLLLVIVTVFNVKFLGLTRNQDILSFNITQHMSFIIGIGHEPILYHFWFIRDLIILLGFSPLLYKISEVIPLKFGALLLTLWFFDYEIYYIFSSDAILFFYLGILISKSNLECAELRISFIFYIIYLLLVVLNSFNVGVFYIYNSMILIGILCWYDVTRYLISIRMVNRLIIYFTPFIFFVFASHEPTLSFISKVFSNLNFTNNIFIAILYLFTPVLMITTLSLIGMLIKLLNYRIYNISTGGR
ncbi:acyltransferase [Vibrio cholerae]|nr:acyltransferase [Vibrio cholerae]